MKLELLAELYENNDPMLAPNYRVRKAARCIIVNDLLEVAVLHVRNKGYYKLPGGGVEKQETLEEALRREMLEEVGVEIKLIREVGLILEYRNQFEQLQISYCFLAWVRRDHHITHFTQKEIQDGFELKWVPMYEAIQLIRSSEPQDYVGEFIKRRDTIFIEKAKALLYP